ncbi:hypothetical protein NESM_000869000 [Novymonas esmeraldas]|uniref:Uncharacterized protein n=1 Tax=Novymonas esmeraldas TaxID=1808958 RepID=A0AAW0EY00_9TRYP
MRALLHICLSRRCALSSLRRTVGTAGGADEDVTVTCASVVAELRRLFPWSAAYAVWRRRQLQTSADVPVPVAAHFNATADEDERQFDWRRVFMVRYEAHSPTCRTADAETWESRAAQLWEAVLQSSSSSSGAGPPQRHDGTPLPPGAARSTFAWSTPAAYELYHLRDPDAADAPRCWSSVARRLWRVGCVHAIPALPQPPPLLLRRQLTRGAAAGSDDAACHTDADVLVEDVAGLLEQDTLAGSVCSLHDYCCFLSEGDDGVGAADAVKMCGAAPSRTSEAVRTSPSSSSPPVSFYAPPLAHGGEETVRGYCASDWSQRWRSVDVAEAAADEVGVESTPRTDAASVHPRPLHCDVGHRQWDCMPSQTFAAEVAQLRGGGATAHAAHAAPPLLSAARCVTVLLAHPHAWVSFTVRHHVHVPPVWHGGGSPAAGTAEHSAALSHLWCFLQQPCHLSTEELQAWASAPTPRALHQQQRHHRRRRRRHLCASGDARAPPKLSDHVVATASPAAAAAAARAHTWLVYVHPDVSRNTLPQLWTSAFERTAAATAAPVAVEEDAEEDAEGDAAPWQRAAPPTPPCIASTTAAAASRRRQRRHAAETMLLTRFLLQAASASPQSSRAHRRTRPSATRQREGRTNTTTTTTAAAAAAARGARTSATPVSVSPLPRSTDLLRQRTWLMKPYVLAEEMKYGRIVRYHRAVLAVPRML